MKKRFIFFLIILVTSFFVPWWAYAPLALLYGLRYTAYELIVLGVVLDLSAGFMGAGGVPLPIVYSAIALASVVAGHILRPYLAFGGRNSDSYSW